MKRVITKKELEGLIIGYLLATGELDEEKVADCVRIDFEAAYGIGRVDADVVVTVHE